MRRGDLVTVALHGDYGKPRPALVVQSDLFDEHPSISIAPVTSDLRPTPLFRIDIEANVETGLHKPSQVMVDKVQAIPRDKIGARFGRVDDAKMQAIDRALTLWFGLA